MLPVFPEVIVKGDCNGSTGTPFPGCRYDLDSRYEWESCQDQSGSREFLYEFTESTLW